MATRSRGWWRSGIRQFRANWLAFVSLAIAVFGLLYNTWRNETTEHQRNVREAAFFTIQRLTDFQSAVNQVVYRDGCERGLHIEAWGHLQAIETLSNILPDDAMADSRALKTVWSNAAQTLCQPQTDQDTRRALDQQQIYPAVQRLERSIVETVRALQ